MNNDEYFLSITDELNSLKNRIRNFVQHWPTDGEWKESVLRSILRRHLPATIGIGKGFIIGKEGASTQIDIIFYDKTKPILYQEGDLLILTPDATLGAIEVKTNIDEIENSLNKLADIVELASQSSQHVRFFGFFSYEGHPRSNSSLLKLQSSTAGNMRRLINCISIGNSYFVRYWRFNPSDKSRQPYNRWHAYDLHDKAPAYFILNVIEHLCPNSILSVDDLWFPKHGKEPHKIDEITLNVASPF